MGIRKPNPYIKDESKQKQTISVEDLIRRYKKIKPSEKPFQLWGVEGVLKVDQIIDISMLLTAMAKHKGGIIKILPVFDTEIILNARSLTNHDVKYGQFLCIFGDYEKLLEEFTNLGHSKSNPMLLKMGTTWLRQSITGPDMVFGTDRSYKPVGIYVPESHYVITGNYVSGNIVNRLSKKVLEVVAKGGYGLPCHITYGKEFAGKEIQPKRRRKICKSFLRAHSHISFMQAKNLFSHLGTEEERRKLKFQKKNKAKAAKVTRKFASKSQTRNEEETSRDFANPSTQLILWVAADLANKQDQKDLVALQLNAEIQRVLVVPHEGGFAQPFKLVTGRQGIEDAMCEQDKTAHQQARDFLRFVSAPRAIKVTGSNVHIELMAESVVVVQPIFGSATDLSELTKAIKDMGGGFYQGVGHELKQDLASIPFEQMTEAGKEHAGVPILKYEGEAFLKAALDISKLPGTCFGAFAGSRCYINSKAYHAIALIMKDPRSAVIAETVAKSMTGSFDNVACLVDYEPTNPSKSYHREMFEDRAIFKFIKRTIRTGTTITTNNYIGYLKDAVVDASNAAKAEDATSSTSGEDGELESEFIIDPVNTSMKLLPVPYYRRPALKPNPKDKGTETRDVASPGFSKLITRARPQNGSQAATTSKRSKKTNSDLNKQRLAEEAANSKRLDMLAESMVEDVTPQNMTEHEIVDLNRRVADMERRLEQARARKRTRQIQKIAEARHKQFVEQQRELEALEAAEAMGEAKAAEQAVAAKQDEEGDGLSDALNQSLATKRETTVYSVRIHRRHHHHRW